MLSLLSQRYRSINYSELAIVKIHGFSRGDEGREDGGGWAVGAGAGVTGGGCGYHCGLLVHKSVRKTEEDHVYAHVMLSAASLRQRQGSWAGRLLLLL
ncbi:hypothetical protein E2C01_044832 [Portunus trituberculatus]|uniref:Uncharacterized protein n=1 Tax=Portunus trituberculatus TaxID=210409 RepID=A0A5B7FZE2_PORTR|nr:hypothetical protein [Portunus trituberculatus]